MFVSARTAAPQPATEHSLPLSFVLQVFKLEKVLKNALFGPKGSARRNDAKYLTETSSSSSSPSSLTSKSTSTSKNKKGRGANLSNDWRTFFSFFSFFYPSLENRLKCWEQTQTGPEEEEEEEKRWNPFLPVFFLITFSGSCSPVGRSTSGPFYKRGFVTCNYGKRATYGPLDPSWLALGPQ